MAKHYEEKFKKMIVAKHLDEGASVIKLCTEYKLNASMVYKWIKIYSPQVVTTEAVYSQKDIDGTITVTDSMIDSSAVDMTTAGSYTVTITVSDEAENEATQTINITVVAASTTDGDTTDPVITVVSDKATEFEVGTTAPDWKEYFTVSDDVDGTITVTDSMINCTVDMTKAGSYKVTITVSDVAGNEATKTINIKVADEDSTNYTPLYIVGGVLWGLALLAGGYIVYKKAYKKG